MAVISTNVIFLWSAITLLLHFLLSIGACAG